jgi:hypothetical protein
MTVTNIGTSPSALRGFRSSVLLLAVQRYLLEEDTMF